MIKQEFDRYIEVSKRAKELLEELQDKLDGFMSAVTCYAPEMQDSFLFTCMVNIDDDIFGALMEIRNNAPTVYADTDSVNSPLTGEG